MLHCSKLQTLCSPCHMPSRVILVSMRDQDENKGAATQDREKRLRRIGCDEPFLSRSCVSIGSGEIRTSSSPAPCCAAPALPTSSGRCTRPLAPCTTPSVRDSFKQVSTSNRATTNVVHFHSSAELGGPTAQLHTFTTRRGQFYKAALLVRRGANGPRGCKE